jgi:hypothetical protein
MDWQSGFCTQLPIKIENESWKQKAGGPIYLSFLFCELFINGKLFQTTIAGKSFSQTVEYVAGVNLLAAAQAPQVILSFVATQVFAIANS